MNDLYDMDPYFDDSEDPREDTDEGIPTTDDQEEEDGNRWADDDEDFESPREDRSDEDGPVNRVSLDWVELEGALENNSPELHSFLNKVTGDVIRIFRGSEGAETRLREVESDPDFLYIEPISSREQYRWMEEFIEIVEEPNLKDKLNIAIDGKGAFRRFKDVLVGYPADREMWFSKRSIKLRAHITAWLSSKNIEPINTPPWEEEARQESASFREESPRTEEPREHGTDLREVAHDLVNLVPSRELPTAVAFLEFLRSRRGFRRPRY